VELSRTRHSCPIRGDGHPVNPHLDAERNCRTASFIYVALASTHCLSDPIEPQARNALTTSPNAGTLVETASADARALGEISNRQCKPAGPEDDIERLPAPNPAASARNPPTMGSCIDPVKPATADLTGERTAANQCRSPRAAARHPPRSGSREQNWSTRGGRTQWRCERKKKWQKERAPRCRRPPTASSGGGEVKRAADSEFAGRQREGLRNRQRGDPD
jgi:hypothetical protein